MIKALMKHQTGREAQECIINDLPQMIKLFSNQLAVNKRGETNLMLAVKQNNYMLAKQFLNQIGMQNKTGKTALMIAVENNYIQFYEMLKTEAGKVDDERRCASDFAKDMPLWLQKDLFEREKLIALAQ